MITLILALFCLCFSLPLWMLAVIIIKKADMGNIFFRQARVGIHGSEFRIIKFRTMQQTEEGTGFVSAAGDHRLIAGGAFMRKYKIDELPQLLNVIRGSMALVGPRPTVREDIDMMTETQLRRLQVLPGLTGLAQISGNTSLLWDERIKYDLEYVNAKSFLVDLSIIVRTACAIVTGKADTHPKGKSEWS